MRKVFRDCYGGTASIKKWGERYILTARTSYGNVYHKKTYASYRGAKIALGKLTEGMYEEVSV